MCGILEQTAQCSHCKAIKRMMLGLFHSVRSFFASPFSRERRSATWSAWHCVRLFYWTRCIVGFAFCISNSSKPIRFRRRKRFTQITLIFVQICSVSASLPGTSPCIFASSVKGLVHSIDLSETATASSVATHTSTVWSVRASSTLPEFLFSSASSGNVHVYSRFDFRCVFRLFPAINQNSTSLQAPRLQTIPSSRLICATTLLACSVRQD